MNEIYELLGLTPEEYKQKEREYLLTLKERVNVDRKRCLQHIRRTFGLKRADQPTLRRLSLIYLCSYTAEQQLERAQDLLKMQLPAPAASSRQDAYHLTHFVNAFSLSLRQDPKKSNIPDAQSAQSTQVYFKPETDESRRLEVRQHIFSVLASHVPPTQSLPSVTLELIYEKLCELHELILNDKER